MCVTHPELVTLSAPGPKRGCLSTSSVMMFSLLIILLGYDAISLPDTRYVAVLTSQLKH